MNIILIIGCIIFIIGFFSFIIDIVLDNIDKLSDVLMYISVFGLCGGLATILIGTLFI